MRWCSEQAPSTASAIRPPQSEDVLWESYGATGGISWPSDVVAFYQWCDGTERTPEGYLFPGFRPLHVTEVAEVWQMFMVTEFSEAQRATSLTGMPRSAAFSEIAAEVSGSLEESSAKAGTEAGRFLPSLLPVAEDQSGSYLMTDGRLGPRRGTIFVYDRDEADYNARRWRNLGALCVKVHEAMVKDSVVSGSRYRPTALGGRLEWTVG